MSRNSAVDLQLSGFYSALLIIYELIRLCSGALGRKKPPRFENQMIDPYPSRNTSRFDKARLHESRHI
jgi:hypothetical protein